MSVAARVAIGAIADKALRFRQNHFLVINVVIGFLWHRQVDQITFYRAGFKSVLVIARIICGA